MQECGLGLANEEEYIECTHLWKNGVRPQKKKPKSSTPSDFCRKCACSFAIRLENKWWQDVLQICGNLFRSTCQPVNYNKRDTIVDFITCLEFCIQKVPCFPKTSLYFASPISRSTSSFVDKTIEVILFPASLLLVPLGGKTMRATTLALFAFLFP